MNTFHLIIVPFFGLFSPSAISKELPFNQSVKIVSVSPVYYKNLADTELFKSFYMEGYSSPPAMVTKTGSGVLVSKFGDIITNFHVVQDSSSLTVISSSGHFHAAKVISGDSTIDLALIKAPTMTGIAPIRIKRAPQVNVGDQIFVLASPFGIINSYTQGRISGIHRSFGFTKYEDGIQVDASINPGASGGGVYSSKGELIGIASGIVSSGKGFQGIGVVIPEYIVRAFIKSSNAHSRSVHTNYGLSLLSTPPSSKCGVLVSSVEEGSYAQSIGFLKGDIVTKLNGKKMCSDKELGIRYTLFSSTTKMNFTVKRSGKSISLVSHPEVALLWSPNYDTQTNKVP